MPDELAKATTKIIYPALKPEGFRRHRTRDLIRVDNGVVQRLYFQLLSWGGRTFCVTACAGLVAGNERIVLQPGFRLKPDSYLGDFWLPSLTSDDAERSAAIIVELIKTKALPYFEKVRTPAGFEALLATERWGANHHLAFQRGVAEALQGHVVDAQQRLTKAIQLYEAAGLNWCVDYIARAQALLDALATGREAELLAAWYEANRRVHGV